MAGDCGRGRAKEPLGEGRIRGIRVLLVVNPAASSVTARARVEIKMALAGEHVVEVARTERRGHARDLAEQATGRGIDVVAVLGGDGTLNEAANGVLGTETALAVLPGGSTNVFARTTGVPNDPVAAARVLLESLRQDRVRRVGVGLVDDRAFLFHTGIGFDAEVVHQVERRAGLKRWAGHPLFVAAAVTTWFRHYDRTRPRMAVRFPDGAEVTDGRFAVVLNTNPYTFLGERPFDVAPEATLDRGLVCLTVRRLDLATILGLAASALRGGGVRGSEWTDYRTDLAALEVTGHGPVPYQVDGDHLGEVQALSFRHEPEALRLVLPPERP
jgi:diacylglycerol kinase family enzyme